MWVVGSSLGLLHEELPLQSLNTAFTNQDPSASMSQQYCISFLTYLWRYSNSSPLQFHSYSTNKLFHFHVYFVQLMTFLWGLRSFSGAPYKDRTERVVYESVNVKTMTWIYFPHHPHLPPVCETVLKIILWPHLVGVVRRSLDYILFVSGGPAHACYNLLQWNRKCELHEQI